MRAYSEEQLLIIATQYSPEVSVHLRECYVILLEQKLLIEKTRKSLEEIKDLVHKHIFIQGVIDKTLEALA